MNFVDVLILIVIGVFLLKGLLRGLMKELCSLVGLVVGALLAFRFHGPLAETMVSAFKLPASICVVLAFLAIFLTILLVFGLIGMLLSRYVKLLYVGGLNRVAGGIFGLVQGALILSVVMFGLSVSPLPDWGKLALKDSALNPPFVQLGEKVFRGSSKLFPGS
ncbi:MAG: colicin V production protein [Desulfuromonas sp.]|nr:MAG: colicin V production protein [Desulfuromonas sp.]